MQSRITGFYPCGKNLAFVDLFAYASRGIPGLEIVGIGKLGRSIKEKFNFFSKIYKVKIPAKRYVLCIDIKEVPKNSDDLSFLELPLLILFWSLADILPIKNLNHCIASGKLNVSGNLYLPSFEEEYRENFKYYLENNEYCLLTHQASMLDESYKIINIENILGDYFKVSTIK